MSVTNPIPVSFETSKGFLGAVHELNTKLEANISWLTKAYGIVQLMRDDIKNGSRLSKGRYPAVVVQGEEYLSMIPDQHLGNYCFWEITEDISSSDHRRIASFKLIVVFGHTTITAASYDQTENVKYDVLQVFKTPGARRSSIQIGHFETGFNNVFAGYDLDQVSGIQLMYPNGAIALNGTISLNATEC